MTSLWPRFRGHGGDTKPAVTQERLQHLENVEVQLQKLEAEKQELERKIQDLEKKVKKEEDLKQLQEQESTKGKDDDSKSLERIVQSLDAVFDSSIEWAREYFEIDVKGFKIDKFPQFKVELGWVTWNDSWRTKDHLNVSHLVQAVVADRLAMEFFWPGAHGKPFQGCEEGFQKSCNEIFQVMLKEDRGKAHRWRATTLSAYEKSEGWCPTSTTSPTPPSSRPGSHKDIAQSVAFYRDQHYDRIVTSIEHAVGPISQKYFPRRNEAERLRKCKEFVRTAGELAFELSKHPAEVRVLEKQWFDAKCARTFVYGNEHMKESSGEHVDPEEKLPIDIILRPCLKQYGDEQDENYDKSSVCIPALVDVKRPTNPIVLAA
ncbi:uncharacterized protein H6S33_000436 [Morchella sextelata]|uniref:uncharacterized protein n=1 Tax=Morchella sextelata TaxID=1174677 RepID=UPI001D044816|nr:uncharacterized protein H6S33_000436 [Morchella sextelata]KAH0614800.1 hypothetical protein H6S33_000436 [Morchella sextelata]